MKTSVKARLRQLTSPVSLWASFIDQSGMKRGHFRKYSEDKQSEGNFRPFMFTDRQEHFLGQWMDDKRDCHCHPLLHLEGHEGWGHFRNHWRPFSHSETNDIYNDGNHRTKLIRSEERTENSAFGEVECHQNLADIERPRRNRDDQWECHIIEWET